MRWLVLGAVCLAACRPFDEALDASIVRLSAVDGGGADGGSDAGLDAGGVDAGGVDAGLDGGDLDAGPDAGATDAGTDDAGLEAGTDAGIDAGPRCIVQKRVAFPNSFTAPAPSAAIAVATVDAAWLVAMVESTGGFQIAKYDGSMVGVPLPIGCGGNCLGVHVSRAGAEPRWFAAGWSPTGAQRWNLAAGGVPNQAMAFGASCINPGNLIGADVVGGADGGSMAVGCDTGFSVNLPTMPQYGDSAGREVRVARNEAGEGRIAWTSDAGCQVAFLDLVTGIGATLVRTGIPELRAIAVDVSPTGDAWLAGLNGLGRVNLYRFDPTGDGGRVNPLALDAVATVTAPVGLAADERGAVVAFSRNNTVYAQPVFSDGGYDRTVIITTDGINPQIAWRRSYGPGGPDLYVVTWIAPSSYMPMLAELSCAPEP